jgi:hypothetical protein
MSDEIKPVPPAYGVQQQLPPRTPEALKLQQRRAAAQQPAARQESDGYDLGDITRDQAAALLATELLQDERALANPKIAELKEAIGRRAQNQPAQQGDLSTLITASQRVDSLVISTYSPGKPATSGEVLKKVEAFHSLAASFGQERVPMRG